MRVGKVLKNRQHKVEKKKTSRVNAAHKAKLKKAGKRAKSLDKRSKYYRS